MPIPALQLFVENIHRAVIGMLTFMQPEALAIIGAWIVLGFILAGMKLAVNIGPPFWATVFSVLSMMVGFWVISNIQTPAAYILNGGGQIGLAPGYGYEKANDLMNAYKYVYADGVDRSQLIMRLAADACGPLSKAADAIKGVVGTNVITLALDQAGCTINTVNVVMMSIAAIVVYLSYTAAATWIAFITVSFQIIVFVSMFLIPFIGIPQTQWIPASVARTWIRYFVLVLTTTATTTVCKFVLDQITIGTTPEFLSYAEVLVGALLFPMFLVGANMKAASLVGGGVSSEAKSAQIISNAITSNIQAAMRSARISGGTVGARASEFGGAASSATSAAISGARAAAHQFNPYR